MKFRNLLLLTLCAVLLIPLSAQELEVTIMDEIDLLEVKTLDLVDRVQIASVNRSEQETQLVETVGKDFEIRFGELLDSLKSVYPDVDSTDLSNGLKAMWRAALQLEFCAISLDYIDALQTALMDVLDERTAEFISEHKGMLSSTTNIETLQHELQMARSNLDSLEDVHRRMSEAQSRLSEIVQNKYPDALTSGRLISAVELEVLRQKSRYRTQIDSLRTQNRVGERSDANSRVIGDLATDLFLSSTQVLNEIKGSEVLVREYLDEARGHERNANKWFGIGRFFGSSGAIQSIVLEKQRSTYETDQIFRKNDEPTFLLK